MKTSPVTDRLGILASTACAGHCAAAALLPTLFGALGLSALLGHEAEWAFTLAAVAVGGFALFSAQSPAAKLAFSVGIAGLLAARFVEEAGVHGLGTAIAIASGASLVFGHVQNLRALRRRARVCTPA